MKKLFLALLLAVTLIGCEDKMAGTKVNEYTPTDANPENMQETIDTQRRGFMALSLSNFDNTSAPQIESGSSVEISGSLYEFTSNETISTTDPVTSSTVADGSVYIVLITSGSSVTASWTASAPTWDSDKQGYYLTVSGTARRVVGGCELDSGSYSGKFIYTGKDNFNSGTKSRIRVYKSSGDFGTSDPLIFDNEVYDTKSEYNITTGIVTIKNTGYYHLDFKIYGFSNTTAYLLFSTIYVEVNGTITFTDTYNYDGSSAITAGLLISSDYYFEAGDTIECRASINDSHGSFSGSERNTYFTLHELEK